jgi:hypothetical protein
VCVVHCLEHNAQGGEAAVATILHHLTAGDRQHSSNDTSIAVVSTGSLTLATVCTALVLWHATVATSLHNYTAGSTHPHQQQ